MVNGVRREGGFTLLEVLVAFAIAAMALGVLYRSALGGLGTAENATRVQDALSRAQSHLAALQAVRPLRPIDRQGDDGGGFRWREHVAVLAPAPQPQTGDQARVALYALRVDVSWQILGRTHSVSLGSARAAIVPGASS